MMMILHIWLAHDMALYKEDEMILILGIIGWFIKAMLFSTFVYIGLKMIDKMAYDTQEHKKLQQHYKKRYHIYIK